MPTLDEFLAQGRPGGDTPAAGAVPPDEVPVPPLAPPPGLDPTAPGGVPLEPMTLAPQAPPRLPPGMFATAQLSQEQPVSQAPLPTDTQAAEGSTFGPGGFLGPESLGQTGGSIVGGALGGPLGSPIGSGIGGAIGKGVELFQRSLDEEPLTPQDWLREIGGAAVEGATVDWIGGKAGGVLKKGVQTALAPFAHRVTKAREVVNQTAERAKIWLTAAQKTGSGALAQAEAAPTRFMLGVEPALKHANIQNTQLERAVTREAKKIAPGYSAALEDVGLAVKSDKPLSGGAQAMFTKAKEGASYLYDTAEQLMDPEAVFTSPALLARSKEIMKEQYAMRGLTANKAKGTAKGLGEALTPPPQEPINFGGQLLDPAALPAAWLQQMGLTNPATKELPFAQMRSLQSALGDLAANHPDKQARRNFARLHSALMEDMDAIYTKNPELKTALDAANTFYKKEVAENFIKNESFEMINHTDASKLAETLLPPRVSIEQVRRIKKTVDPKVFDQLAAGWMLNVIQTKALGEGEKFSIAKFIGNTNRGKYSNQVLNEILGPERAKNLQDLRKVFLAVHHANTLGGNPSMTGRAILGMGQVSQLTSLGLGGAAALTGNGELGTAALLVGAANAFGPLMVAKIMFSKGGSRYLAEGSKMGQRLAKSPKGQQALFQTGKIPTMLSLAHKDWPWETEGMGESPATGVRVDVPQGQGMPGGNLPGDAPPQPILLQ